MIKLPDINNVIKNMRKEWIKQNENLKKFVEKDITFAACYHEGYKDGIEKVYQFIKNESNKLYHKKGEM